jgi:hypothetical protein
MSRLLLLLLFLACAGCDFEPMQNKKAKPPAAVRDAQRLRVAMDMRQLLTEVEQHYSLRGEWPESWRAIRRSGLDPWGNEYVLLIEDGRAIVSSAGPDGEPDTDDDIYSDD